MARSSRGRSGRRSMGELALRPGCSALKRSSLTRPGIRTVARAGAPLHPHAAVPSSAPQPALPAALNRVGTTLCRTAQRQNAGGPQGRRTAGRLNAGRGHNRPRRPPLGTTVGGSTIFGEAMGRPLPLVRPHQRPLCPDFGGDWAHLPFCEAWRCAVDLRRGLTGDLAHCPICGIAAVATYRLSPRRPRR
jgi:hypothetical protein